LSLFLLAEIFRLQQNKMIKKSMLFLVLFCFCVCIADGESLNNANKSPDAKGICTYRIIDLKRSRFQPTEVFTADEKLAIIVKGYGRHFVTVKIFDASTEKEVFKLEDYIPALKNKIWIWESLGTGIFQAALFIEGNKQDAVNFKVVP